MEWKDIQSVLSNILPRFAAKIRLQTLSVRALSEVLGVAIDEKNVVIRGKTLFVSTHPR